MTTPRDRFAEDPGQRAEEDGGIEQHRPSTCERFDLLAPELALGSLTGADRSAALAHLETCDDCATSMAELSAAADAILLVAPEADPPAGFEVRWLSRVRQDAITAASETPPTAPSARREGTVVPLRRRARLLVAAAAAVAIAAAGVGVGAAVAPSRGTVAARGGIRLATLYSSADYGSAGKAVGEVAITGGSTSWVLMTYQRPGWSGWVDCVVTSGGHSVKVGSFSMHDGSGSWALRLPAPGASVTSAQVWDTSGDVLATATFSS